MKKKKKRALTLRERRFIKALPTSKSISEAMRKAGYSDSVIDRGLADSPFRKTQVLTAMQEALEKAGISDEKLAQKIKEGLDCEKVVTATEKGIITDEKAFPDFATQHRYLDTALTLRSDYPNEKLEVEHTGLIEVFHIPLKDQNWGKHNEPETIDVTPKKDNQDEN